MIWIVKNEMKKVLKLTVRF